MGQYDIVFKGYKCFNDITTILDIRKINVFIGKNNIGKSSILDIIGYLNYCNKDIRDTKAEICETLQVDKEMIYKHFDENSTIIYGSFNLSATPLSLALNSCGSDVLRKVFYTNNVVDYAIPTIYGEDLMPYKNGCKKEWTNLLRKENTRRKRFKRINAERDILPENDSSMYAENNIKSNGTGITCLLNKYLSFAKMNDKELKRIFLEKLNTIMGDEAYFTDIKTQIINDSSNNPMWEIYLDDKEKTVSLSKSGSGLKTIIFILMLTIIVPEYEKHELHDYIFAFEEIENNLHPSLLRRTLHYLEEVSDKGAQLFFTTHSNVMLDAFSNSDKASVYEVYKEDNKHIVRRIDNYNKKNSCLDELGVKASDILQSNGIIWVEGPSDRIYINKWIELWSKGKYREGMNYQCMIYGGKLLADEEFQEETTNEFINLLNMNRNSMIVMDSDINSPDEKIRKTKERIIKECKDKDLLSIVTDGREIENYIPQEIINEVFELTNPSNLEKYEKISEYLEANKKGLKQKFINRKVSYAKEISEKMSFDSMKQSEGLDDKMSSIIKNLEKWNKE